MRSRLRMLWSLALLWGVVMPRAVQADPAPAAAPAAPAKETAKKAPFEAEIAAFEKADTKKPPPQGAALFVGSSSIRLWTTLAKDIPELTTINRGFGGSQIEDSVRYADRIVIPYKPKLIVFYAGGNDINAGKTPQRVLQDYQAFVEKVHAALPATRIVYISINPSVSRWKQEEKDVEANRLIENYVKANDGKLGKLTYIDTHSKLLSADGKPRSEYLRADGLHLNAQGYELWAGMLRPQLVALWKADNP